MALSFATGISTIVTTVTSALLSTTTPTTTNGITGPTIPSQIGNDTEINPGEESKQSSNATAIALAITGVIAAITIGTLLLRKYRRTTQTLPNATPNITDQNNTIGMIDNPMRAYEETQGIPLQQNFLYEVAEESDIDGISTDPRQGQAQVTFSARVGSELIDQEHGAEERYQLFKAISSNSQAEQDRSYLEPTTRINPATDANDYLQPHRQMTADGYLNPVVANPIEEVQYSSAEEKRLQFNFAGTDPQNYADLGPDHQSYHGHKTSHRSLPSEYIDPQEIGRNPSNYSQPRRRESQKSTASLDVYGSTIIPGNLDNQSSLLSSAYVDPQEIGRNSESSRSEQNVRPANDPKAPALPPRRRDLNQGGRSGDTNV